MKIYLAALIFFSVLSSSSSAQVILRSDLGTFKAGAVIPLEKYFSLLCQNCTNPAKLPRFFTGLQHFPADGLHKIKQGLSDIKIAFPQIDTIYEPLVEFYRVLEKTLSKFDGVDELTFINNIIDNEKFLSKEYFEKITEASIDSIIAEGKAKIKLMQEEKDYSSQDAVRAAICEHLTKEERDSCRKKHEAFLILNQFFTQVLEQMSEGMIFCEDAASCAQRPNTLYNKIKLRKQAM